MQNTIEQFAIIPQPGFDTAISFVNVWHSSVEQLTQLNLASARATLEDTLAVSNALIEAEDFRHLMISLGALTQPSGDRISCYCRDVSEILRQSHDDLAKLIETQTA